MTGSGDHRLDLHVLGPVGFTVGDESLEVGRRMERTLAVRLALARGRVVPDEAIARDLWGDEELEPERVAERLRVLTHRLRRALGEHSSAVRREGGGYALDAGIPDADALDEAMTHSAALRRTGEPKRALAVITEALARWRGPALADLRDVPFAAMEAAKFDELQRELRVQRVELELDLGIDVTADIERLVMDYPLDERLTGLAVIALYRAGRQADALERIQRLRSRLADELGVDPSVATTELELQILRQDPTLQAHEAPRPSRLPDLNWLTPRDNFVGRDADVHALVDELDRPGLVSIVGGPGAGKTLLAREVAIAVRRGNRPIAWCDLAPLSTGSAVAPALAAALGVDPGVGDPLPECADRLTGALLVLDNAEHLVDSVAELVRSLQWKAERLSILVTSQRPLRLRAEHTHQLDALEPEAAAELFRLRCRSEELLPGDLRVAEICAAVDHLPLGIELAAGLVRTLTLDQLAARIHQRTRLLVAGNRDSGARHSSLRAAIDWSHTLLDPPARTVLNRLAVFAGGCTLDAAEQVAGGNGIEVADIPVLLADLHERSLLTVSVGEGGRRYQLLESIRDYALDRLGHDEDAVRRVHARWCADLAGRTERYGGADHADLDRELRLEEANLWAAIEFALDDDPPLVLQIVTPTWWYWWSHGSIDTARDWLRRALAAADPEPTLERASSIRVAASLTRNSGQLREGRVLGEQALQMFRELGDERGYGASLVGLAITSVAVRDYEQALKEASEAAGIFRALDNQRLLGTAENVVASALRGLGRTEEAGELFETVCELWRSQEDLRGLAATLCNLALVRHQLQDYAGARADALQALRIYQDINLAEGIIDAIDLIGGVELAEGNPAAALRLLTVGRLERIRIGAPQIIPDELDAREGAEAEARRQLGTAATAVAADARVVPLSVIARELAIAT
ncbi:BTAD domain-containing putative transcriptional regulator [Kribbella sp. NPDC058245]|uniref:BTAD domain-containing putative transcriptional regulator n=1 Tax=Kribbella sp. NPDC058245 TaxID=3346399 RepID=UPI0036E675D3